MPTCIFFIQPKYYIESSIVCGRFSTYFVKLYTSWQQSIFDLKPVTVAVQAIHVIILRYDDSF